MRSQRQLNKDIRNYNNLKTLQQASDEIIFLLRDSTNLLGKIAAEVLGVAKTRGMRGFGGLGGSSKGGE
jgi:hypothetical protein